MKKQLVDNIELLLLPLCVLSTMAINIRQQIHLCTFLGFSHAHWVW